MMISADDEDATCPVCGDGAIKYSEFGQVRIPGEACVITHEKMDATKTVVYLHDDSDVEIHEPDNLFSPF